MKKDLSFFCGLCLLFSITLSGCFLNKMQQKNNSQADLPESELIPGPITLDDDPQGLDFYPTDNNEYYVAKGQSELLSTITIPSTYKNRPVVGIMPSGFSHLKNTKKIILLNTIEYIGENAFYMSSSLSSLNIPSSIVFIGNDAFSGCESLNYTISEYGYYLGDDDNHFVVLIRAIESSENPAVIDKNCRLIYYNAFSTGYISSLTIPDGVKTISSSAFINCYNLTEVFIPKSVTRIDSKAFLYCSSLTIYCKAESKPDGWASDWNSGYPVVWGY